MPEVTLRIGGRAHVVACREGEEAALAALGRRLDAHAAAAARAAGVGGGERTMLFIALMLADELGEAGVSAALLDRVADSLERVADTLEKSEPTS
jgi:cell division protein ZapA